MLVSDRLQPPEAPRSSDGAPIPRFRISVIVVATERLFRLGLARLLSEDDRLDVIAADDGDSGLVGLCKATSVDVVLMDVESSRTDTIDLLRMMAAECPHTKTLLLTSSADWRVRPAMVAGAAGVLLKDASPEAIIAAVVSVHLGDQVLCAEAARWVLGEDPSIRLTHREADVLRMVATGANNTEIAAQLQLGQKTVRNYVSRLYHKLALDNRSQLATYVVHADLARRADHADVVLMDSESLVPNR